MCIYLAINQRSEIAACVDWMAAFVLMLVLKSDGPVVLVLKSDGPVVLVLKSDGPVALKSFDRISASTYKLYTTSADLLPYEFIVNKDQNSVKLCTMGG